jgi:hypothetical protein
MFIDVGVNGSELMAVYAVRLFFSEAVAFRVAQRAHRLHIRVVLCCVSEVVIVLMSTLTLSMDVPTIRARQPVRMRASASTHLNVDTLARLLLVTITGRLRRRARAPSQWVCPGPHRVVGPLDFAVLAHDPSIL